MNAGLTDFRQRWDSRFYWPFDGSGGGAVSTNPVLQSITDSLWYRVNGQVISGNGLPTVNQTPVAAGTDPDRVIENLDDGLFYTVQLVGVPPLVQLEIVPTPTADPEIPAVITISGNDYEMKIVNDPFPTITLVLVP